MQGNVLQKTDRDRRCKTFLYRASHVLVDLGCVDFDLGVSPSCPAAQPPLPHSHLPKQSRADSRTIEIQVNKTQSTTTWDALYRTKVT